MRGFGSEAIAKSINQMKKTMEKYNKFVKAGENPFDLEKINRGKESLEWINKNHYVDINKFFLIIPMAIEAKNLLRNR